MVATRGSEVIVEEALVLNPHFIYTIPASSNMFLIVCHLLEPGYSHRIVPEHIIFAVNIRYLTSINELLRHAIMQLDNSVSQSKTMHVMYNNLTFSNSDVGAVCQSDFQRDNDLFSFLTPLTHNSRFLSKNSTYS